MRPEAQLITSFLIETEAPIQRRLSPRQLVTPTSSTFQHRQRPQNSPCGSSWTESSLPVALLASDVLPRVRRYGGPLAERDYPSWVRSGRVQKRLMFPIACIVIFNTKPL
mgnify:CR=1 FL=1